MEKRCVLILRLYLFLGMKIIPLLTLFKWSEELIGR